MISKNLDAMIADAMKAKDKDLLEVLKLIKCEMVKAEKDGITLDDVAETKILLKMVAQREDSIKQYTDGNRLDLAAQEALEKALISEYLPKQPTDEDIENHTRKVISAYALTRDNSIPLSMRDMKPILTLVQSEYPTANGKIVSKVLNNVINNK